MNAKHHITRMTLREKCAQMVFAGFRFDDADFDRTRQLIKAGIGGFLLSGGTIFDVASTVNAFQKISKFPLLMAGEYECGAGRQVAGATVFPSNLAVSATGSEELAKLKGRCTAIEAKALGVPWILAPVVDPGSFGADPEVVSRLARAFVRGLHEGRALACAKRFPGGDGPLARLREMELRPYMDLSLEVDSIMTSNAHVTSIDPKFPVSLSRLAIEGILRRELLFDGVVCAEGLSLENVEAAASAGVDAVLCPADPEGAVAALEEAVKGGRLSEQALTQSVERIFTLKERAGLFGERVADIANVERFVGCASHLAAAKRIAEAAVTLLRGAGRLQGPVAVLGNGSVFERELGARLKIQADAERCVIALFGEADAERHSPLRHKEVVVVAFGSPSLLRHFPEAAGCVCAYGDDEASQLAAARALAGEIEFKTARENA